MSQYAADYLQQVIAQIQRVHDEQLPQLNQAAQLIANTLQAGGLVPVRRAMSRIGTPCTRKSSACNHACIQPCELNRDFYLALAERAS